MIHQYNKNNLIKSCGKKLYVMYNFLLVDWIYIDIDAVLCEDGR